MPAAHFLAYAERYDPTVSNLATTLICAGIVLVSGILAFIPIAIARTRRHRQSQTIFGIAMLWAFFLSLSAGSTTLAEMKYSHEHMLELQSGYADPLDTSDVPKLPWPTWAVLGVGYGGIIAWSLTSRSSAAE